MRILISNDDGVIAPGLVTLAQTLSQIDGHEIYVCAPDRQRSATGHSLTLHKPLRVEEVQLPGNLKKAWSTSGTPADCVKLALCELLESPPDLVISGINSGPNLGSDMLYSGTVAAAMEAAAMNFRAIAISAQNSQPATFEQAARFVGNFLPYLDNFDLAQKGTARRLININVPSAEKYPQTKGVCLAKLGLRIYKDQFEKRHDPHGRDYYWLSGSAIEDGEDPDSDVNMLSQGYITVTPVFFNMTDLDSLNSLKAKLNLEKLNQDLRSI